MYCQTNLQYEKTQVYRNATTKIGNREEKEKKKDKDKKDQVSIMKHKITHQKQKYHCSCHHLLLLAQQAYLELLALSNGH